MLFVIAPIIWIVCGYISAELRKKRNRTPGAGWVLGILLGPIGILICALQS